MAGAFLYLVVCSVRNRIRVRLRRLREPRYLVGLVAGLAYMAFVLSRYAGEIGRSPGRRPDPPVPGADFGGVLGAIGAVGLFVTTALAWVLPGTGRPALTFSRAEVQWLFTAPIARRTILHYKILRSLAGALIGSAIVTLVFRPGRVAAGWTFFLGTIVLMATVNLHLTGIAMRRQSLRAHGRAGWARQWLPLAVVAVAAAALGGAVAAHWPTLIAASGPAALFAEVQRTAASWPARLVLWPFGTLVRLPLSVGAAEFLAVLPMAGGLLALNYVWVLRSDVAFEEAAARDATDRAAPGRTWIVPAEIRRREPPFELGRTGRPEVALLWKNLILAGRYATWGVVWRILPVALILAFVVAQSARTVADALAVVCAIGVIGTVFIGPQIVRNDLRQDLTAIATLKAWPLSGATILRGEVLAPTVLLTAVAWTLAAVAVALSIRVTFGTDLSTAARLSYGAAAMVVAPGLILAQVVVQNGLAVLFPAWVDLGGAKTRGMDVMGQRLLVAGALFIAVGIALLPAVVAAGVVQWSIALISGRVLVLIPAAIATAVLVAECAAVLQLLGRVMDRTDLTAIPAEE
jgi:ABC-2 type transport system permease protein